MGLTGNLNKIQELLLQFKQNSFKITTGPFLASCQVYLSFALWPGPGEPDHSKLCSWGAGRPRKAVPRAVVQARLRYKPYIFSHSLLPLPAWGLQQVLGNKESILHNRTESHMGRPHTATL